MEPLLKRVSKILFGRLKSLVNRNEPGAVKRLAPIFEKILAGNKETPLAEFIKNEPPNFRKELKAILDVKDEAKPLFTGTKEVPVEQLAPQATPV